MDDSYRLSNADREQTAAWLRDHLMAGRLTIDEFSERVETVYSARFGQELVAVREGLPENPVAPTGRAASPPCSRPPCSDT